MLKCDKDDEKEKDDKGLVGELLKTRSIIISEPISDELAKKLYAQMLVLNERSKKEPIRLYINSPGGDADSGFGIYDFVSLIEAPVHTIVTGLCASAAVIIFLGAEKGKSFATPNSRFLLHQPSTGIHGTASDLEITAEEILKTRERYNQIVADVTGKSVEQVTKDSDRDFWMSPQQGVEYGLVSKVIAKLAEAE